MKESMFGGIRDEGMKGRNTSTLTPLLTKSQHETNEVIGSLCDKIGNATLRESFIRKCLQVADDCAGQGDTAGILRCLASMREVMGMLASEPPLTVREILESAG